MIVNTSRRKRKRRPTMTPRFGSSSIALEIGLLRLTIELQKELTRREEIRNEYK